MCGSMDDWARSRALEPNAIGWCHDCWTFQRYKHARQRPSRRSLCVNPDCIQTWGSGIWDLGNQPDFDRSPCWPEHADSSDAFYPRGV